MRLTAPLWQREVTQTIEEFEAARRRVRMALITVVRGQGSTMAEAGQMLGISRQLVSRLTHQAETTERDEPVSKHPLPL